MQNLKLFKRELKKLANKKQARILAGFFKTGQGQYGAGDIFLGIKVPALRIVAKKYADLSLAEIQNLLDSKIHEQRLIALLILLKRYGESDEFNKKRLVEFYLKNTENINNWDLVDLSCHYILGDYLLNRSRRILYQLAKSKNLWERRIAVISTFAFIRKNEFSETLKIAEILMNDQQDLIHKAAGWMLREVGKRDQAVLEKFLQKRHQAMPRTMLRYAVEKFSERKRKFYLNLFKK